MNDLRDVFDLLIVGGGINGAGIARDAAGRSLRTALCDAADFGGATSSASTKLIHGGLRYLEHFAFRLVAESLAERETIGRIAGHLIHPLRFVMPHQASLRPAWMIQFGLFLYDRLGGIAGDRGKSALPSSARLDLGLHHADYGAALKAGTTTAFAYSDLAVDDARLVIANLRSAAILGASILPRHRLLAARRENDVWRAELLDEGSGRRHHISARALINAAGPWVAAVNERCAGIGKKAAIRLVKGSHLVLPRLYAGDHAYLLQNEDRRVVFLIPYRRHFTLLGTTEVPINGIDDADGVSADEVAYLLAAANRYLAVPVTTDQVVHRFWGCRPLFDDGSRSASAVTRDYRLLVDDTGAPHISIIGGKLTTYRRLAETVIARLPKRLQGERGPWTADAALPGSAGFVSANAALIALEKRHPWLPRPYGEALIERYGSAASDVIGDARDSDGLGRRFADLLCEREVEYLVTKEWARAADDILWRRSKAGLEMSAEQRREFSEWFEGYSPR